MKKNISIAIALASVLTVASHAETLQDRLQKPSSYNGNGSLTADFAPCIGADVNVVNNGLGSRTISLPDITCNGTSCNTTSFNNTLSHINLNNIASATIVFRCSLHVGNEADTSTNFTNHLMEFKSASSSTASDLTYINGDDSRETTANIVTPWLSVYGNTLPTGDASITKNASYSIISSNMLYKRNNTSEMFPRFITPDSHLLTSMTGDTYSCKVDLNNILYTS